MTPLLGNKKYGTLIATPRAAKKNVGDYIQSIAQQLFLPRTDVFVEREALRQFRSDTPVKTIMNGWYMWQTENWPPLGDSLEPLFVSMHIAPRAAEQMLTEEGIAYLKRWEPIGARDTYTQHLLAQHGVQSYFSGCLTLTLGKKYHAAERDGRVYFVDTYFEKCKKGGLFCYHLRNVVALLRHFPVIRGLSAKVPCVQEKKLIDRFFPMLRPLVNAAVFYRAYSRMLGDDVLKRAEFIEHEVSCAEYPTDESQFALAHELLEKYAKASLVVTSRIHAALPCIGMETPTLFVTAEKLEDGSFRTAGRFGGLIDLMHYARFSAGELRPESAALADFCRGGKKITMKSQLPPPPYAQHHDFVDAMVARIRDFLSDSD